MGRKTVEVPLPLDFAPPETEVEFSDAERRLIAEVQARFGLTDPSDALTMARVQREMEERRQRGVIDEIIAVRGQEIRDETLATTARKLDVSLDELRELLANPDEYRALMKMKTQANLADIPTAQKFLADHRRRTAEQNEAATDRWQLVLNFSSKPPRGDDWRRMDKFGPMVAAEVKGEKRMKNAFRKQKEAAKPPKPKKPSWRKNPKFKEAAVYFAATRRGIVPDKLEELNRATGREAELLNAEAELDKWDKKRQEEGLDYAGFPWPDGET